MPGESFARTKQGFRFMFRGWKTNDAADAFPPEKYPTAVNIRGYDGHSIRTRPGQVKIFQAGANPITDIGSYSTLLTDNRPRILARDTVDAIWLDDSTQVGTLAAGGPGAVFVPFRPNESPQPYLYAANGADYQKFSAPNPPVVASKVGIAEPQPQVEAACLPQTFVEILSPGGNWNTGGTASAWSFGSRSADIVVYAANDPVSLLRWSVQVSPTVQYQRGEIVYFNATPQLITIVEDVIAPLSIPMTILAIYYRTDGSGTAVVALTGVTAPASTK